MWVIFEGLDKAGKTTLEWEFLKATNFKHMIIDRGPAGYMTFDRLFNRSTKESDKDFVYQARKVMDTNQFMVVYCVVNKDVADQRLKDHNETCPYDYLQAQRMYRSNVYTCYDMEDILELDTTNRSIDECVALIVKKLQEALKRSEHN